jgi:hypothetical protein
MLETRVGKNVPALNAAAGNNNDEPTNPSQL